MDLWGRDWAVRGGAVRAGLAEREGTLSLSHVFSNVSFVGWALLQEVDGETGRMGGRGQKDGKGGYLLGYRRFV